MTRQTELERQWERLERRYQCRHRNYRRRNVRLSWWGRLIRWVKKLFDRPIDLDDMNFFV